MAVIVVVKEEVDVVPCVSRPLLSLCARLPLLDFDVKASSRPHDYRPARPDPSRISCQALIYSRSLLTQCPPRYTQRSPTETPFLHLQPAVVLVRIDTRSNTRMARDVWSRNQHLGFNQVDEITIIHLIAPGINAAAGVIAFPSPPSTAFPISIVAIKFAMHSHRLASTRGLPGQTLRPNPHTASTCSCTCGLDGCKNLSGSNTSGSGYTFSFRVMALYKSFGSGMNRLWEITNQTLKKTLEPPGNK